MDPLTAMRQQFTNRFGRAPTDTELGDLFIGGGLLLHAEMGMTPTQVLSRIQQMMTPGTPLNVFLRQFK